MRSSFGGLKQVGRLSHGTPPPASPAANTLAATSPRPPRADISILRQYVPGFGQAAPGGAVTLPVSGTAQNTIPDTNSMLTSVSEYKVSPTGTPARKKSKAGADSYAASASESSRRSLESRTRSNTPAAVQSTPIALETEKDEKAESEDASQHPEAGAVAVNVKKEDVPQKINANGPRNQAHRLRAGVEHREEHHQDARLGHQGLQLSHAQHVLIGNQDLLQDQHLPKGQQGNKIPIASSTHQWTMQLKQREATSTGPSSAAPPALDGAGRMEKRSRNSEDAEASFQRFLASVQPCLASMASAGQTQEEGSHHDEGEEVEDMEDAY
ncbi:uncharacterized protein BDZ99DRAFT_569312 [Mytilinidion resinicola]|uniref:Uncharacterized protein n=1 Tax=Mytilinidion resinicola TaxID=574789 RepID=A0A6A6YUR1_9PEZI|nr:uncharacterized protein BDZ99DRAFT_569312 [Mytilinidion resinicola]KAF2812672.1 hypothetical protein BDZ99DRAFT_569312 [Mytilinidion resinicola]